MAVIRSPTDGKETAPFSAEPSGAADGGGGGGAATRSGAALATALRSPLFGLDEAQLYALAQGRGGRYLWSVLREETQRHGDTLRVLLDLRAPVNELGSERHGQNEEKEQQIARARARARTARGL